MKNINMKKIVAGAAALGVSALLAGSVVAANVNGDDFGSFNELTKDQLFTSGVPAYNIVVGSMGQTVDVVWAGNIAAAIGKKAYMSAEEAGTGSYTFNNVVVTVGTEAGATVTGDGYLSDNELIINNKSGTDVKIDLTNTDYSALYDDDVSGNITNNSSYTIRQTETLDVNLDTFFSTRKEAQDILTFIDSGKIIYKLEFAEGVGLPISNNANDDEEYFTVGDTLPIKFMGGTYELQSATSNKVTLVGSGSKVVKRTGDLISVGDYELEIGSVTGDGKKVYVSLKQNGIELAASLFKINDKIVFSGHTLADVIKVISLDSLDNSPDFIELSIGSDGLLELEDGKVLPGYGTSSNKLWRVDIDGNADFIYDITVTNDRRVWNVESTSHNNSGLQIDDSIELPLNLGSIEFMGLTDEPTYEFKVGENKVSWVDNKNRVYEIPIYEQNIGGTAKFGFKDYYFDVNSDKFLNVHNGTTNTNGSFYSSTTDADQFDSNTLLLDLGNGVSIEYDVYRHGNVYDLALAEQDVNFGKSKIGTWALDLNDANVVSIDGNIDGNKLDYRATTNKALVSAKFNVQENVTGKSVDFYIDYYTQDLVNKADDWTTPYPGQADINAMFTGQKLDQDKSDDLKHAYSEYGSYVAVDGYEGYIQIPEAKRFLKIFIGGGATLSPELIGDTLELSEIGAIVKGENGTQAKLDSYDITAGAVSTEGAIIPGNWNVNNNRLVWLDQEAPSTPLIIVGGYKVNSLAVGTYGLEDIVTVSGQYVAGIAENNNLIVAGMDAADTAAAAKELITAIENM